MKNHTKEQIREKIENYKVRVTSFLKGRDKNAFFLDTIKRNSYEAYMIQQIVGIYYAVMDADPTLKEKTFTYIKEELTQRIKESSKKLEEINKTKFERQ